MTDSRIWSNSGAPGRGTTRGYAAGLAVGEGQPAKVRPAVTRSGLGPVPHAEHRTVVAPDRAARPGPVDRSAEGPESAHVGPAVVTVRGAAVHEAWIDHVRRVRIEVGAEQQQRAVAPLGAFQQGALAALVGLRDQPDECPDPPRTEELVDIRQQLPSP